MITDVDLSKATPRPWVNDAPGCIGKHYDEGGKKTVLVAPIEDAEGRANAALATIAVNEYETVKAKIEKLQAERDDLQMDGDAIIAIRQVLEAGNVPVAAFVDDHVRNAIIQRDQERARVAELERENAAAHRMIDSHAATISTMAAERDEAIRETRQACAMAEAASNFMAGYVTERDAAINQVKVYEAGLARMVAERTKLATENASMRAALEPFALDAAELADGIPDDTGLAYAGFPDLGLADFTVADLRRARAALAAPAVAGEKPPAPVESPAEGEILDLVKTAIAEALGDAAFDCTRVWEAWSYGTMGPNDFVEVHERADEIAAAAMKVAYPAIVAAERARIRRVVSAAMVVWLGQAMEATSSADGIAASTRADTADHILRTCIDPMVAK